MVIVLSFPATSNCLPGINEYQVSPTSKGGKGLP